MRIAVKDIEVYEMIDGECFFATISEISRIPGILLADDLAVEGEDVMNSWS